MIQQTEYVNILPSVEIEELHFISGHFGPFKVNKPIAVPMWLGVHLKRSNKCRILKPAWLCEDYLKGLIDGERSDEGLG